MMKVNNENSDSKKYEKTVGFIRVSTKNQNYDMQLSEISKFCIERGWKLSDVIAVHCSGVAPEYKRKIHLLKELINTRIVMYDLYRLSRKSNWAETSIILEELTNNGNRVYCTSQPILNHDGPMGDFLKSIFLAFGAMERAAVIERMKAGQHAAMLSGKVFGRRKGQKNRYNRLDKYRDEIKERLAMGVTQSRIIRDIESREPGEKKIWPATFRRYIIERLHTNLGKGEEIGNHT